MIGQRFGRLVVIAPSERRSSGGGKIVKCVCDCGVEKFVATALLLRGNTTSCGCYGRERRRQGCLDRDTHRMTKTGVYKSWLKMKERCQDTSGKFWHRYGGRGIVFCERWNSFDSFFADMGSRPDGTELDRINNDGNYEPENCRWISRKENVRNRGNALKVEVDGAMVNVTVLAERLGLRYHTVYARLTKLGWSVERIINESRS